MTYQPQITQELDFAADQAYAIRFEGHVDSLGAAASPATEESLGALFLCSAEAWSLAFG